MRAVVSVSALFLAILAAPCSVLGLPGGAATDPERKVILRELALMGATQLSLREQDAVRVDLLAREYVSPKWKEEITERIRYAWQRKGYFRADVELLHEELGGNGVFLEVVVVANIEEGRLYRFGELRWKNPNAFSPAELNPLFPLIEGEVFDPDKVRQGLEALRRLYAFNGYINFTPVPDTEFDDARGVINIEVDLDEGDQFRVGSVEFHARDSSLLPKLLSSWKLRVGDIYDGRLVEAFALENEQTLPPDFSPYGSVQLRQDVRAKTVHIRVFLDQEPLPEFDEPPRRASEQDQEDMSAVSLRRRE